MWPEHTYDASVTALRMVLEILAYLVAGLVLGYGAFRLWRARERAAVRLLDSGWSLVPDWWKDDLMLRNARIQVTGFACFAALLAAVFVGCAADLALTWMFNGL